MSSAYQGDATSNYIKNKHTLNSLQSFRGGSVYASIKAQTHRIALAVALWHSFSFFFVCEHLIHKLTLFPYSPVVHGLLMLPIFTGYNSPFQYQTRGFLLTWAQNVIHTGDFISFFLCITYIKYWQIIASKFLLFILSVCSISLIVPFCDKVQELHRLP